MTAGKDNRLGVWLADAIKACPLSRREVAALADVSPSYISLLSKGTGNNRPSPEKLVRLALALGKSPAEALEMYGLPPERVAELVDAQSPSTAKRELHELFAPAPIKDLNVNVVGSPKGGVGRTLLLIHAALIGATGCEWAGIAKNFSLMMDFDFNAPGIHTYPLLDGGSWFDESWRYRTLERVEISQRDLEQHLIRQQVGLVFWLHALAALPIAAECRSLLGQRQSELDFDASVDLMKNFIVEQVMRNGPFNPLHHLISVIDQRDEPRLAFFLAGSPQNPTYADIALNLRWQELIGSGIGLVMVYGLLRALQELAVHPVTSKLLRNLDQVWIDQSPGQSWETRAREKFSNHQVLVSSLAPQSYYALEAWIRRMPPDLWKSTWVNLTYYRGRHLFSVPGNHGADAARYAMIDRAAQRFEEADDERLNATGLLENVGVHGDRIVISDFEADLLNKQTLRGPDTPYYESAVRLLIAMQNARPRKARVDAAGEVLMAPKELMVLAEYAGPGKPEGVFKSLFNWLKSRFKNTPITAFALEHEEIVRLATDRAVSLFFQDFRPPSSLTDRWVVGSSSKPSTGNYWQSHITLDQFDFAAIPGYAVDDASDALSSLPVTDVAKYEILTSDHVNAIDEAYLRHNVRGWSEALSEDKESKGFIRGVPLFSHYPLIVSKTEIFDDEVFRGAFKVQTRENFSALLSFANIRDAAAAAKQSGLDDHQLVLTTHPVPRVYEWLVVLGISGCNPFPEKGTGDDPLIAQLAREQVFDATLDYALLDYLAVNKPSWNEALYALKKHSVGFMFAWPDSIETNLRQATGIFTFAPVPAELQLSETWLLTIPKKAERSPIETDFLWKIALELMTKEEQTVWCKSHNGVPVHKHAAADPVMWKENEFAKILGLLRSAGEPNSISIPRSFSPVKISELGKILAAFCEYFRSLVEELRTGDTDGWHTAFRIHQNPQGKESVLLREKWKKMIQGTETSKPRRKGKPTL